MDTIRLIDSSSFLQILEIIDWNSKKDGNCGIVRLPVVTRRKSAVTRRKPAVTLSLAATVICRYYLVSGFLNSNANK